ncbi:MAG: metal-dependent transcriptional regulator [Oscillospiraceae bacterium]|jgi:Mn-dependent DtxR family transcriptional regulator|nr:metal-dependent transcriptional regulator [Oscillospiraceae bacterium]
MDGTGGTGEYRTLKGYQRGETSLVTHAMEDYLEMICRCLRTEGAARVGTLAARLAVKPSSASKMAGNLRALGLLEYENYGVIHLTDKGFELGSYLLRRHDTLHRFFCLLNGTRDELEQTEKVEHYIDERTLRSLEDLIPALEKTAAPIQPP